MLRALGGLINERLSSFVKCMLHVVMLHCLLRGGRTDGMFPTAEHLGPSPAIGSSDQTLASVCMMRGILALPLRSVGYR